jgi:SAM-dependent methyltransferase
MGPTPGTPRLYGELAWLFPIITPLEHYLEETEQLCRLIRQLGRIPVESVLHLGCGAGHSDFVLKRHFRLTGVDSSPAMLGLARKLNPEVDYRQADMRELELDRRFQAVVSVDALDYLASEEELERTFRGAFRHLEPGGLFLFVVEQTRESFVQDGTVHWTKKHGELTVTLIENNHDPNPDDSTYEYTLLYLIRRGARLRIETDSHLCGLFPEAVFLRHLEEAGFEASRLEWKPPKEALEYAGLTGQESFPMFVGIRPL